MSGKQGVRPKQLLDGLKEVGGCWNLKEETLDRPRWRPRFERGCQQVVRETTK